MKNNHKKTEELHFLKNAKRNMRKNKQITAKKEKMKTTVEKNNNNPNSASKKK